MSFSLSDSSTQLADFRTDIIELDEKIEEKRGTEEEEKKRRRRRRRIEKIFLQMGFSWRTDRYHLITITDRCLFDNVIVIFRIDFSYSHIDAHGNSSVIPLIVVTHEESDTTSSPPVHHPSTIDNRTKTSYSTITSINMDNISLKGRRDEKQSYK